jgi:glycosyltransferase involved in cell wall biosynthesis
MDHVAQTTETPLRIVHYSPGVRLELGGVVRAVLDWCIVLAARGHDVTLVTFDSPDIPYDWNGQPGKPKVVFPPEAYWPNFLVPQKTVRVWRDILADGGGVAHLHTPWTASNLQMAHAARKLGIPYVVSIHGMLDDWAMQQRGWKKRMFLQTGGRKYLCAADRLHFTAAAEQMQARKWVDDSNAVVLPYLVDLAPFQPLPGKQIAQARFPVLAGPEPKLLFLSRLHEKKGVDLLIEAAGILRGKGIKFKLIIAGSGSPDYQALLKRLTQRLNLTDVVKFLGLVTGVEKISLYQAADIFILPTHQENFGLVLIEALAAGTPVVTTRGTDIWQDIAAAGGSVIGNSPDVLAAELQRLLENRESLPALGERGRQWVLENLNTETLARGYEKMYSGMLKQSPSAVARR